MCVVDLMHATRCACTDFIVHTVFYCVQDADAPSHGDRNFETIGQTATLFYVSVTHNFFTEGRQLYAVNIMFDKQGRLSTI